MKTITAAARREKRSISSWATERLVRDAKDEWPPELLATFGALKGTDFKRWPQSRHEDDAPRRWGN